MHALNASDETAQWGARLERTRTDLVQKIAGLTRDFDEIVRAAADVATDDEHDPEGHTIAWERQQVVALLDDAKGALAELDDAAVRLETGTYGVCSTCGRPIAADRLDALPTTPFCITCAF